MNIGVQVGLGLGHIVLDGDPAPCERGTAASPLFGPCLLLPRSPISAAAEHLYQFLLGNSVIIFRASTMQKPGVERVHACTR